MKFSNSFRFYPDNTQLVSAIDHCKRLSDDQTLFEETPDRHLAEQNIDIHTRGNYEQQRYSEKILDSVCTKFESILLETHREQSPLEWATLHISLGNVRSALADFRMDVDLFEQAIQSFRLALEEFTRAKAPLEWAATQYDLATATQALGGQQNDSKLLKKSIDTYTDALLEWSRKDSPQEWALTMFQLGAAFHTHGKLLKGDRTFQKSIVAYKNALAGFDADNNALELAATHNNRGIVLQHFAESEDNTDRLEDAIKSYETAETVCMEQQLPFHLAVLCKINRATARVVLAQLTRDPVLADETADDFELIVELFHDACQPHCLAHCEEQLDGARSLAASFA